jgi:DNA-binding MarR family transcriptional regulator
MTDLTTDRIRKSVKLTPEEGRALAKWVRAQATKIDAALLIGITRQALDTILIKKSGSQESIEKIKKVLGAA